MEVRLPRLAITTTPDPILSWEKAKEIQSLLWRRMFQVVWSS